MCIRKSLQIIIPFSILAIAYAFGYALNILEYMVIWGLQLQRYAVVILIAVSIIFIFVWFYKPVEVDFYEIEQSDYILLILFLLYLLVNVISYSGYNISPLARVGTTIIDRDIQFWCSNAVALKNSFLPVPAYFSGSTLNYHYFSSMHVAFISEVSGISIFDTAFTLFPFGKCILIVGSLSCLIDKYTCGSIKYLYYLSVLFMTGWEKKSLVTFAPHITYHPFGFDIGS